MNHFASVLSVQLTIPMPKDPTVPSMSAGAPTPVLNQTGLDGIYDIDVELKIEPGADTFAWWQRALQEFGLKLEAQRAPVEILVVDRAEKLRPE
jgi:uncharacterized protein (TIGR03435 family)